MELGLERELVARSCGSCRQKEVTVRRSRRGGKGSMVAEEVCVEYTEQVKEEKVQQESKEEE